jgi:Response regulator receiver domain
MAAALGPCVAEPAVEARCVDPYSPRSRWSGPESSRLAPIRTSNVLVLLGVPAGRNLPCRRGSHLSRDSLTRQPGVTRIRQIGAHPSGLTGSKRDGGRRNHPKPPTMRIVLAEDELLLSEGMASLLERSGFMLVGQAGDAVQLSRWAATPPPDLVVVDIRMPPTRTREGLETAGKSASSPRHRHSGLHGDSLAFEPATCSFEELQALIDDQAPHHGSRLPDRFRMHIPASWTTR